MFWRFVNIKTSRRSPVLLYAECVSEIRLGGPDIWESPLSGNCGVAVAVVVAELRLQSLMLEKV